MRCNIMYNISIFGSHVSSNLFNDKYIKEYGNYFNVVSSSSKMSLISLMSEPFSLNDLGYENKNIDEKSWDILNHESKKIFLDDLKNKKIDYLILDNLFESQASICCFDEKIITNVDMLNKVKFYDDLNDFEIISMENNPKKYFKLWVESINLFFDYLDLECSNVDVVLHKVRNNSCILRDGGNLSLDFSLNSYCNKFNPIIHKFDRYVEKKFDIDTLELNQIDYPIIKSMGVDFNSSNFINEYYYDGLNKLIMQFNTNALINKLKKDINNNSVNKLNYVKNNNLDLNESGYHFQDGLTNEYFILLESIVNNEISMNHELRNELTKSINELRVFEEIRNHGMVFDNKSNKWVISAGKLIIDDNYLSLTKNSKNVCLANPNYVLTNNKIIEFDVYFDGITSSKILSIRSNKKPLLKASLKDMELHTNKWYHIIIFIENNYAAIHNTYNSKTIEGDVSGLNRFYFRIGGSDTEIRFKNFTIDSL